MEKCLVCGKDISAEIPNDWEPTLCYSCAKKGAFKKNGKRLVEQQKTIWDSIQHKQSVKCYQHGECMKKYCQTVTEHGIEECGFLVGNVCKADKNNNVIITGEFHKKIQVVGCQSWSKYMDWSNGRENTVSGLPVCEMAVGGQGGEEISPPMRALQEDCSNGRGDSNNIRPVTNDMRAKLVCFICNKPAVANDNGIFHCEEHHDKFKLGQSEKKMMDDFEARK